MIPFFVSIPHSGEQVPDFCHWLQGLPEPLLMRDVDRYVDVLYEPALRQLNIPFVKTTWHRYAADMNRTPEDIDQSSVQGAPFKAGTHARGFHWVVTTLREPLMKTPMPQEMHQKLVQLVYEPFHRSVQDCYKKIHEQSEPEVFHLDAHSMPSVGTSEHRDPGQRRADIVVSDCGGKSCKSAYVDLVIAAYSRAGFKVGYNWPYAGGRVTEVYGKPERGHHVLQVELNRALYMNEETKKILPEHAQVQKQVSEALAYILKNLPGLRSK